jgi:hypothetical protein
MEISYCWAIFFETKKEASAKRVLKRMGISIPEDAEIYKFEKYYKDDRIVGRFFYTVDWKDTFEKLYYEASQLMAQAAGSFTTQGPHISKLESGDHFESHFSNAYAKWPGVTTVYLDVYTTTCANQDKEE